MILFEWIDRRRLGVLTRWRAGLQPAQRAQLDQKTLLLEQTEPENLPGLWAGPITDRGVKCPRIYKLRIGGKVRLRPLLCRGPLARDRAALTFLAGAQERGGRFRPEGAPRRAIERRTGLISGRDRRRRYEVPPA